MVTQEAAILKPQEGADGVSMWSLVQREGKEL